MTLIFQPESNRSNNQTKSKDRLRRFSHFKRAAHASDHRITAISCIVSKQGERVGERAVLTQLIEPQTIDPRVVDERRKRRGGAHGGEKGRRAKGENTEHV